MQTGGKMPRLLPGNCCVRPGSQRSPYLGEGQTVLVLVLVFHFEIIQGFALGRGRRQGPEALHVAGGQEAVCPMQLPVEPVLVHPAPQDDDITLVELEVTRFFPFVTVESFAVGKLGRILKAKHNTSYPAARGACSKGCLCPQAMCRMPSNRKYLKGTDTLSRKHVSPRSCPDERIYRKAP